jgi:hypothetical protein
MRALTKPGARSVYSLGLTCACTQQFGQFNLAPQLRIPHAFAGQLESEGSLELSVKLARAVLACHVAHVP